MMEEEAFRQPIEIVRRRLDALFRRADGGSARQKARMAAALEEISTALEEIEGAGEALHRQNDELAAVCKTLEAERRRYRELFEFTPEGYLVTDAGGVIGEANRAAASQLHTRQDLLVDKPLADFVVGEEREEFDDRLAQLQAGRLSRVVGWELRMKAWGGMPFWAAVTVVGARDAQGRLAELRWLVQDITQRKWAEEALLESEERYRTIADSTQDGLTIIEDGRTVYANDRACQIFGYPLDEYLKMTSLDFAAPEEQERLDRIVEEIKRTGAVPKEVEYWIVRKDGSRRCISNRYSHIRKGEGGSSRLVITTDVTERRRAAETLKRRAAQLALLNDVGEKIAAVLELDSVLDRTARLVQGSFGYHHVGLFTLDRGQKELVMRAKAGDFADLYPPDHRLKMGQGMVGWVGQHGKRLLANDVSLEPCYVNLYPEVIPTRAELSVPIRVSGEVVGVLDVQSPLIDAFDENDVLVMETLTDQVAVAIENARLYEAVQRELDERRRAEAALRRRAAQLALLNDVGGKIAIVLDLDRVLDRAAQLVHESFGYHHVGVFTLDREQEELVMRAKAGDFIDLYPPGHRLKLDQGMVGWVGRHGKSLLANDVSLDPRYVNLYPDVVSTRSELCVPIGVGGEVVGVLDVQSPLIDAFDEDDVLVMETLADQVAVAIENARLYAALQESEVRYRAISELASDFAYGIRVDSDDSIEFDWVTDAFTRITGFTTAEVDAHGGWRGLIHRQDLPTVLEYLRERLSGKPNVAEYRVVTKSGGVRWLRDYGRPERDEAEGRVVRIYGAARDVTESKQLTEYMLRTERLAAMGHMATALTHEIEVPLQTVRASLGLALDPIQDPAEHEARLRLCQQEIEGVIEVVERVLALTRPSFDAPRAVSIDSLMERTLALLEKPLQRAQINLTIDVPSDFPPVLVVPDRAVQALLNLVINAIEAVPEGGRVRIAAHRDADGAVIVFANDGPPIPQEYIEQVFDPFFTTKSDGMGLGLYISQNIVEQHGGTIRVENLEGEQGVAFSITLPVADPASMEKAGTVTDAPLR